MQLATKVLPAEGFEVSDAEVDAAVAACGGGARATVKALLIGQIYLHHHIRKNISAGHSRRLPLARLDAVQGK